MTVNVPLKFRRIVFGVLAILLAITATSEEQSTHQHHHHGGVVKMDAEGKRLESYDVKHDMDQETMAALRAKIALYRGLTDMELNMNMSSMGPNYEWYASDLEKRSGSSIPENSAKTFFSSLVNDSGRIFLR